MTKRIGYRWKRPIASPWQKSWTCGGDEAFLSLTPSPLFPQCCTILITKLTFSKALPIMFLSLKWTYKSPHGLAYGRRHVAVLDDDYDSIFQKWLQKQIGWLRHWRKPAWHRATCLPSWGERRVASQWKSRFWRRPPPTQLGRTWVGLSVEENWSSSALLEQQRRRGSERKRERPVPWNWIEAKREEEWRGKRKSPRAPECVLFMQHVRFCL